MIGILSDTHSNLEALKAVLPELHQCDLVLNAGDLVGYGPDPNEVIRLTKKFDIVSVQGNHDYSVAYKDFSGFNAAAEKSAEWTYNNTEQKNHIYLKILTPNIRLQHSGLEIFMVHGSPRDYLNEYVYPNTPLTELKQLAKGTSCDILIMGHTHMPFIKRVGRTLIINPGSVGQPMDGDNRASFALFDPITKKAEIKRMEYNLKETQRKIMAAGLPTENTERLESGR